MALAPALNFMPYDVYAYHGQQLMQTHNDELKQKLGIPLNVPTVHLAPVQAIAENNNLTDPVGILGAGPGGMYAAMMLEELGIPYQILEARPHVGGRLFTYKFPNSAGAPYNYFDIGAMRFPNVTAMNRTFELFENPVLNTPDIALRKKLRPYYFYGTGNNSAFLSYNGVTARKNAIPPGDAFKAHEVIKDTDPSPYIAVGASAIIEDALKPFATGLYRDLQTGGTEGWKYMMKFDKYSVRAYLLLEYIPSDKLKLPKKHLSVDLVNWVETYETLKDRFDRGLTDYVLDEVSFGWRPDGALADWYLIDGGSEEISKAMYIYLSKKNPDVVSLNSRVTAIAFNKTGGYMDVVTNGEQHHRFSHIINTIPPPVMRMIDLKGAGLSSLQWNALRQLNTAPSLKIGMQWKSAWWTTANDASGQKLGIIGGQSSTDSPLQNVVYPSYGDSLNGKTQTMIASYSTMDETLRMGSWIKDNTETSLITEPSDDPLVTVVLRNLADMHNVTESFLRSELIATKPWSWGMDPYSMGAVSFFGPGKFQNLYTSLTTPAADGRLHFGGEAISTRHAWMAGALDGAWRAVREMLLFPPFQGHDNVFFEKFGVNLEWVRDSHKSKSGARILDPQRDMVWEHVALTHPEH